MTRRRIVTLIAAALAAAAAVAVWRWRAGGAKQLRLELETIRENKYNYTSFPKNIINVSFINLVNEYLTLKAG